MRKSGLQTGRKKPKVRKSASRQTKAKSQKTRTPLLTSVILPILKKKMVMAKTMTKKIVMMTTSHSQLSRMSK